MWIYFFGSSYFLSAWEWTDHDRIHCFGVNLSFRYCFKCILLLLVEYSYSVVLLLLPSTAARPSFHWVICNLCPHLPCWAALLVWVLPETEALGRNRHRKQTADRRQRHLHNLHVFTERSRMAHSRTTRLWPEVMLWGQKDLLFKL